MNYIFSKYEGIIMVLVGIPVGTALLMLSIFLFGTAYNRFSDMFKLRGWITGVLTWGVIILSAAIALGSLYLVYHRLYHGGIRYSYLVTRGSEERLAVWLTRVDHPAGVSTAYTERYISFNIDSGKELGRMDAVKTSFTGDYWIYGPFGTKLWAYCEKTGVLLLDLFKPEVLADDTDIMRKNPVLKPVIKIASDQYDKIYEHENHTFSVAAANGEIYRVAPDLTIQSAREPARPPQHKDKGHTHILRSWKHMKQHPSKKWSIEAGNILAYTDESGRELNRINLGEMFEPDTRPYTLLHRKHETLILVTRDLYTLDAIRTDPETGKVLGTVHYFK